MVAENVFQLCERRVRPSINRHPSRLKAPPRRDAQDPQFSHSSWAIRSSPYDHFYNELAEAERNRTSAWSRLPLPKYTGTPCDASRSVLRA